MKKIDFNPYLIWCAWFCFWVGIVLAVLTATNSRPEESHEFLYIVSLIFIMPFIIILGLALIQNVLIKGEHEIFEQLLNDSIILKLVCDKQLKQNWIVFEKALILRVQELINDGIVYKFNYSDNKFVKDLVNYNAEKDRDFKKQQCQIEAQKAQELQDQQTAEEAQVVLNKIKIENIK